MSELHHNILGTAALCGTLLGIVTGVCGLELADRGRRWLGRSIVFVAVLMCCSTVWLLLLWNRV